MLLMLLVLDVKFLTQGHTYIWVNFWVWYKVEVQFHSFACGYPVVLALFVQKTITSLYWIVLELFSDIRTTNVRVYLSALNSVLLIYVSVLILVPHYIDSCHVVVSFGTMKYESSQLCSFQGCFDCFVQFCCEPITAVKNLFLTKDS